MATSIESKKTALPLRPYIAISGIMGSGKTTLAHSLSKIFELSYIHHGHLSASFMNNLFGDENRWATESQMAFLIDKFIQIKNALSSNEGIVLDRSLSEDIDIFARYFIQKNQMDNKESQLYTALSKVISEMLRPPDIILYCSCDLDTIRMRLISRSERTNYPENHLEEISDMYNIWLQDNWLIPIYQIDTKKYDSREDSVIELICSDIIHLYNSITDQLEIDLFSNIRSSSLSILAPLNNVRIKAPVFSANSITKKHRKVYIAAPFTNMMTSQTNDNDDIFGTTLKSLHGEILKKDEYRAELNKISSMLKKMGLEVVLPHRDINNWGKKTLTPIQVYAACVHEVSTSSLFVGILGSSNGSHLEYGYALGMGIPTIIIHCEELSPSYISQGIVQTSRFQLVIRVVKYKEIIDAFNKPHVIEFIKKSLENRHEA